MLCSCSLIAAIQASRCDHTAAKEHRPANSSHPTKKRKGAVGPQAARRAAEARQGKEQETALHPITTQLPRALASSKELTASITLRGCSSVPFTALAADPPSGLACSLSASSASSNVCQP